MLVEYGEEKANRLKLGISLQHKGKILSEKHRSILRQKQLGKHFTWSEEARKRVSYPKPYFQGKNNPNYGNHWTEEQKQYSRNKWEEKIEKGWVSPLKGRKLSALTIEKILKNSNRKPNKFEQYCSELFQKSELPLKYNKFQIIIGGKIPDFVATNDRKVFVEVFNTYFKIYNYGSVENYVIQRKTHFAKYGYETLFFTVEEIKSQPEKVISQIREALSQRVLPDCSSIDI